MQRETSHLLREIDWPQEAAQQAPAKNDPAAQPPAARTPVWRVQLAMCGAACADWIERFWQVGCASACL